MMNSNEISNGNRIAWNEAQSMKSEEAKQATVNKLREGKNLIHGDILNLLLPNIQNKIIAQFCCNNGRELLSLDKYNPRECIGFDISDALINEAKLMAAELKSNCKFIQTNIADIKDYKDYFDIVYVSIGAMEWFDDLDVFFNRINFVLKQAGVLIIHEVHPFINLIALPQEIEFNQNEPTKIFHSYFKKEPWINEDGMFCMVGKQYKSKPFICFSHTFSEILNAICTNGLSVSKVTENDYDIGSIGSPILNGKGFPLSFLLEAKKN